MLSATEDKKDFKNDTLLSLERDILQLVPPEIRSIMLKIDFNSIKSLEEIRLRADKPLMLHNGHGDWLVSENGSLLSTFSNQKTFLVRQSHLIKSLELMSENSIYAFQDEIKNGYITLKGGHRVGICGKAVVENGSVKNIKDISGLNIRISREVTGCAGKIIGYVMNGRKSLFNTLVISPPQCGKTTLLRDTARILSDGIEEMNIRGFKVGVVDERSEIAACYKGVPQMRVGIRTDVLDGCPKAAGMLMMIRSMSPQVIVTDEIGSQGDAEAVLKVLNAGVKIITSAHGYNISELKSRQEVLRLLELKVFERIVVLGCSNGPGTVEEIMDGTSMSIIYRRG